MRAFHAVVLVGLIASGSATAAPGSMTRAECVVWQRELGFARSVANHDAAAFASYLHPGAVFIDDGGVTRGASAVLANWTPLIKGEQIRLRWHPERVVIGGDPDTALSMGAYWIEDLSSKAEPRFRVGRFVSTWKRGRHGLWRVLFDGGGGGSRPATTEQVRALQAGLPIRCPS